MSAPSDRPGRADVARRQVWIDAQLPPALARWLAQEHGVTAVHVQDAGLLDADDPVIFEAARSGAAAVVIGSSRLQALASARKIQPYPDERN